MDSLSHTFFECASPLSTSSSLSLSSSTSSTSSSSSCFSDILSPISPTDTIVNDELIESLSSKLELATSIEEEIIQHNNKKNSLLETFRQFQSFLVDTSTNSLTWMTPPEVDDTITLPTTNTNDIYFPPPPYHVRSLRANPDHLRMIVAEVNMMRANKIISPLRPRAVLLERNDPFLPCQPSPLKYCI
ncbi:hypothetical protein BJ944DRAFT_268464 [Cunninghamella echinulata]|nr:hypothetical protein BJ944DRAFT_268464 [Cunninghamella echinulata]